MSDSTRNDLTACLTNVISRHVSMPHWLLERSLVKGQMLAQDYIDRNPSQDSQECCGPWPPTPARLRKRHGPVGCSSVKCGDHDMKISKAVCEHPTPASCHRGVVAHRGPWHCVAQPVQARCHDVWAWGSGPMPCLPRASGNRQVAGKARSATKT